MWHMLDQAAAQLLPARTPSERPACLFLPPSHPLLPSSLLNALPACLSSRLLPFAPLSVRVMNIYMFVNSKTLFRTMRYEQQYENHLPAMVHVNYHPDKYNRLLAVQKRYVEKDIHALDGYPTGSCHNAPNC